jgi:hypothetical protein
LLRHDFGFLIFRFVRFCSGLKMLRLFGSP